MRKNKIKKIKNPKLLQMMKLHKREGMEKDFFELLKRAVKSGRK